MQYTNAQKLAAVLTEWSHPAITQIASDKLACIPALRNLQNTIISSGLVNSNYNISYELKPFVNNISNSIVQPMLESYLARIPDSSLPALAHSIVNTAMQQPRFSLLGGLIEFEQNDIMELKSLLEKNLPLSTSTTSYQIIK